ncbi:MAG TPA: hypothetical protein VKA92_00725 [Segetibacter sp.]|nr:hypothetical protein [Segetibacter sp.]
MKAIIDKVYEYLEFVSIRAIAHEKSAEGHRSSSTRWRIAATALSAIVGSALFVTITEKFGFNGEDGSTFPPQNWPQDWRLLTFILTGLVLVLSPVLTRIQAFLNEYTSHLL